jgi:hypothetical protein
MLAVPHGICRCGMAEMCHNMSSVSLSFVIERIQPYGPTLTSATVFPPGRHQARNGAGGSRTLVGDPPP